MIGLKTLYGQALEDIVIFRLIQSKIVYLNCEYYLWESKIDTPALKLKLQHF